MQSACTISYCHVWLVWVYHIFPYDLINGKIFETKVIEQKMCDVLATNLSEIYLILRRDANLHFIWHPLSFTSTLQSSGMLTLCRISQVDTNTQDVRLNRGVAEDTSLLGSDSVLSNEWVTRLPWPWIWGDFDPSKCCKPLTQHHSVKP